MSRPFAPFDEGATTAAQALAAALRARVHEGRWTYRALSGKANCAMSTLSDVLRGRTLPRPELLHALCRALEIDPGEAERLRRLHHQAMTEREDARAQRRSAASLADQAEKAGSRLKKLREAVGCSVRELVELAAEVGVASSKSSIARALDDPARDPALAYALAESMVRLLPREERELAYAEVCRPVLDLLRALTPGTAHGDLHPNNILVPPRTAAQLQRLRERAAESGRPLDGVSDADLIAQSLQATLRLIDLNVTSATGDSEADVRLPDGTALQVKTPAAEPARSRRTPDAPSRRHDPPATGAGGRSGMDAFTAGLLQRIRATESDLRRAREEGDDFLVEVEQDELNELRRLAAEHGVEPHLQTGRPG